MNVLTAVILSTFSFGGAPAGELLDFSAKWCGPCQQMGPVVDRLHRQGYPIRKVDIDENRELARRYNISSIPAFVLVVNGKVVEQTVGMQSEQMLMQMMAKIPKPEPKAGPDFDPQHRDAPILANQRQPVVPPSAPKWIPSEQPQQQKGLIASLGFGQKKPQPTPNDKDIIARGKIDQKPLDDTPILTREPLVASTRNRITDKGGTNFGSGTIIDSKVGYTLILTCGHIFRNFQDDSLVEVDVFQNGNKETFVGQRVKHDLQLDLGLISIPTDNPLPFARVASGDYQLAKSAAVVSVGCGQGNAPTEQKHVVTYLNRYKGPSNIECTGVPVQGRSGGGLFNQKGELVGICMAADEKGRRGLYVGLPAVQGFLKSCNLLRLLKNGISPEFETGNTNEPLLADNESDSSSLELKGVAALQAALGEAGEGVVCVVKSEKNTISGQRVVVLPRTVPTEPVETSQRLNRQKPAAAGRAPAVR
jgi:thiol-disulfide isomerase/thioredoxin